VNWLFQFRNLNEGMFQLHATEDIFFEALHAKRKRDARAPSYVRTDRIEKIRGCVGGVLPTPPGLISVTGSDQGDNHSHAAAISSRADVILTQNSSTDITQTSDDEPYEIYSADDFFLLVVRSKSGCLLSCTANRLRYWGPRGGGCRRPARRSTHPSRLLAVRRPRSPGAPVAGDCVDSEAVTSRTLSSRSNSAASTISATGARY